MFSKFLRRISVAVIGVIFLLGAFSGMSLCAKAQSPGTGELEVFQIEQVRAEMPQIQVYVRGVNANEACEAYLDGNALTSTGNQSLDENGTSYLIMLDISGSITSEYFLAAKKQVEELAQNLGPKDKITLITFGDTVKMQVSDSQNADEISKILALLQAKDKKTNLYRAFDQCLKYVEAESQKERQIVLVISDGIQDTGDAGITQEELETRLTQASMPVYAFCVDTADRQSRDGLGTFARTTGGELFVFGPQNAAQVWQKWKERLNQTVCLGFESTANYADGELHTLLLKETAGAQSDTRQIRITNWLVDDVAPEVISFRYDNEKNTIEIEFSEPVLGADKANAYAPEVPSYYQGAATAMIQLGNFSGANDVLEQMKTAIPQAEQSGDYQIVQGELLRKQGDLSGALQATYKAIETSDDNDLLARAYRLAASICEEIGENKISEEIELLEHGIERLPGGYYNALAGQLATSYIRQAEVTGNSSYQEKALQTYQKMEDNGNTTLEVRLNIAMLQYQLRDFTDAMETLQALKIDYPKDYRVYKWLAFVQGEIDLKNGASYTKSLEYYTTAVELYRTVQASGMYDPQMDELNRIAANNWQ